MATDKAEVLLSKGSKTRTRTRQIHERSSLRDVVVIAVLPNPVSGLRVDRQARVKRRGRGSLGPMGSGSGARASGRLATVQRMVAR